MKKKNLKFKALHLKKQSISKLKSDNIVGGTWDRGRCTVWYTQLEHYCDTFPSYFIDCNWSNQTVDPNDVPRFA